MSKINVRPWASRVPGIAWAIGIDLLDALKLPLAIPIFPMITEPLGIVFDGIQGFISFMIFDEPLMWVGGMGGDAFIPETAGADFFMPSYTISYIILNFGTKKR